MLREHPANVTAPQSGVASGAFRQDLYYRLNVIPISLPSLAQRGEDIRELALHFISHANQVNQRKAVNARVHTP
jgi:transcriptional regulator with PAS, ATPase and Fis domain